MIELPVRFKTILEKDSNLYGIVLKTVSDFSTILEENSLFFFEEYTDHGIKHIQSVINSADEIIPVVTFELMTSQNVACLILAIILHDLGMHTSFLSFKMMIGGSNDDLQNHILDKKTWKIEWDEYLDKGKKFNTKEAKSIFGKEDYFFNIPDLKDKDKLNGEDKKLIGEFIRRNHPRIAHEIAVKGIPVKDGFLTFANGLDFDFKNIVGIIARSHGVNIRSTFPFLESISKEEWSKPYNVDIIFLMVILRIADYFQFDNKRTNPITVKLKSFNSPLSKIEFDKHLSINFVQVSSKDPETLYVQAKPKNSVVFLRLHELILDIQKELDLSWAILGEIYGKEPEMKQPKIKYRRIKANILESDFKNQVKYVAQKITFNTDEELSKLLIAPLYGNNPSYGVRELLQNAIDACIERKHIQEEYEPKITVKIFTKNNNHYFEIRDNGKGMTLSEITNYFLKAGSSFRRSYDWQKRFTNDKGEAKIQRSGRFGVGALAAFLLGEKLMVQTKSYFEENAYSFTAQLHSDQIEVQKESEPEVGTVILIPIRKEVYEYFADNTSREASEPQKWTRWYTLSFPSIDYYLEDKKMISFSKYDPTYNEQLPNDWHSIKDTEINRVDWTYSENYTEEKFTCNGIVIPKGYRLEMENVGISAFPKISVFDLKGKLALNLNRNSIDGKIPFENELLGDIYKDLIAQLLTTQFSVENQKLKLLSNFSLSHPSNFGAKQVSFSNSTINRINTINSFIFSNKGFGIRYAYFLKFLKQNNFIIAYVYKNSMIEHSLKNYTVSFEEINGDNNWYNRQIIDPYYFYSKSGKVTSSKFFFDTIKKNRGSSIRRGLQTDMEKNFENNDWISYTYRYRGNTDFISNINPMQDFISSTEPSYNFAAFRETYIPINMSWSEKYELFDQLLEKYLGQDCTIPYDMEERIKKFPKAFTELEDLMKKYKR